MSTSNLFFTSASPVVVLSPTSQPHSFSSSSDSHFASQPFFRRSSTSFHPWSHSFSFSSPAVRQRDTVPQPTAFDSGPRGRKRCRDEEDADGGADAAPPSILRSGSVVNGESMMTGQPDRPFAQRSEIKNEGVNRVSQSPFVNANDTSTNRPIIPRRKLQRLHTTPSVLTSSSTTHGPGSSKSPALTDPPIDSFTLRLGIGWTNLNHQPDKQAALRGWARYVEKNFPGLTNAQILLQSKRLNDAFLVRTDQGYFLFDEEMSHGRLVGRTEERTLSNLTAATTAGAPDPTGIGILFDGEELARGARVGVGTGATGMAVEHDGPPTATATRLHGEVVQDDVGSSSMAVIMDDEVYVHGENGNGNTNADGNVVGPSTTTITTTATAAAVVGALMDLD